MVCVMIIIDFDIIGVGQVGIIEYGGLICDDDDDDESYTPVYGGFIIFLLFSLYTINPRQVTVLTVTAGF